MLFAHAIPSPFSVLSYSDVPASKLSPRRAARARKTPEKPPAGGDAAARVPDLWRGGRPRVSAKRWSTGVPRPQGVGRESPIHGERRRPYEISFSGLKAPRASSSPKQFGMAVNLKYRPAPSILPMAMYSRGGRIAHDIGHVIANGLSVGFRD